MNIEHTDLNPTSHSQANSPRSVENESRIQKREVPRSQMQNRDEAELSDLARVMAKLHPYLEENPEVRMELVESLKAKIQDGTYKIPIDEIVERIISGKE